MTNLKDEFMKDDRHDRVEGTFVVCLTSGTNFMAETVWRMKTYDRDHFRFNIPTGGEHRFEPERVEAIIEINA